MCLSRQRINAPAEDLIKQVVDDCMSHPEIHLNPRGEIGLQDVQVGSRATQRARVRDGERRRTPLPRPAPLSQLFLKADDRCRHYLGNLDRMRSADVENLYKQQAEVRRREKRARPRVPPTTPL